MGSRVGDLVISGIVQLQWMICKHQTIRGLAIGVPWSDPDRTTALRRLQAALDLVGATEPRRMRRLQRDCRRLLVTSIQVADAQFHPASRTVLLEETYVCKPEVTPGELAATIVHEATHARLFAIGIGYPPNLRPRIERLCMREELNFAEELPDGAAVGRRAEVGLTLPDRTWDPMVITERRIALIRSWGWPGWIVRLIERGARRSAA